LDGWSGSAGLTGLLNANFGGFSLGVQNAWNGGLREFRNDAIIFGGGEIIGAGIGAAIAARAAAASRLTSVFWSGRGIQAVATKWAAANGGTTLEMTAVGRALEAATKGLDWVTQSRPMWVAASEDFAKAASGEVHVFHGPLVSTESVWGTVEYKSLMANPNVTSIVFHVVGVP
jgi:hypothetical protein